MNDGYTLRDGSTTQDRKLDLIRDPGKVDLERFSIREVVDDCDPVRTATRAAGDPWVPGDGNQWEPGPVLDQGAEGACVGFAFTGDLLAKPRRHELADVDASEWNDVALAVYHRAQDIDPWPETKVGGEGGTSIQAGAEAAIEAGHFKEYRWADGIDDLTAALLAGRRDFDTREVAVTFGPAIVGVDWRETMYDAEDGVVRPGGEVVGGHAILITGVAINPPGFGEPVFIWRNSWGTGYGLNGSALVSAFDLENLLGPFPEICFPVGRKRRRED